ncbi:MAG: hypothetical protein AMXMBFR34_51260 [Myxococcaceae bacterium]
MRLVATFLVLVSSSAAADWLVLPPSEAWIERPSARPMTREFTFKARKTVSLSVSLAPGKQLRDPLTDLDQLSKSLERRGREEAFGAGVTESRVVSIGEAAALKVRVDQGPVKRLTWMLPVAEGSLVVGLVGEQGDWEPGAEEDVERMVLAATGLRPGEGNPALHRALAVGSSIVLALALSALVLWRRRRVRRAS